MITPLGFVSVIEWLDSCQPMAQITNQRASCCLQHIIIPAPHNTLIVPIDRFIYGYQSRNERLTDPMRRCGIWEEKLSFILSQTTLKK